MKCNYCGYDFPEELGKYGCPNCLSDGGDAMQVYYNEIDSKACDWLSNLMDMNAITPGMIDQRSIEDITPDEVRHYDRAHFFAGIGVWDYALNHAGWQGQVWTGSCPCQPFSSAGKGKGTADERHLWPAFEWLIQRCRPEHIFGEQVAGKAGESWFDLVQADLAHQEYTSGMSVLAACSVGAPHIRKRIYWAADRMADTERTGSQGWGGSECPEQRENGQNGSLCDVSERRGPTNGHWAEADWLGCRDAKWRPVEPGTFPLVDGAAKRVGRSHRVTRLKGYGNAITAPLAIEFIKAAMQ